MPIYLFALKMGLGVALLVTVVVSGVSAAVHGDVVRHVVEGLLAYPGRALMVFAWTTVGFAGLDYAVARIKLTHKWDPRALPKLVRHEDRMSRANSLCEFLALVAAMAWLLLVPQRPFLLLGPPAALLDFAPIWGAVYLPIFAVTLATAVLSFVNFTRPFWTPARSLARMTINAASSIIFLVLYAPTPLADRKGGRGLPRWHVRSAHRRDCQQECRDQPGHCVDHQRDSRSRARRAAGSHGGRCRRRQTLMLRTWCGRDAEGTGTMTQLSRRDLLTSSIALLTAGSASRGSGQALKGTARATGRSRPSPAHLPPIGLASR